MQRLSGRLQESNHRASLQRRGPGTSTKTAINVKVSWPLITTPQTKFERKFIVTDVLGT